MYLVKPWALRDLQGQIPENIIIADAVRKIFCFSELIILLLLSPLEENIPIINITTFANDICSLHLSLIDLLNGSDE